MFFKFILSKSNIPNNYIPFNLLAGVILIFSISCSQKEKKLSVHQANVITYLLESTITEPIDSISLSYFCNSIHYIPLQSSIEISIGRVNKVAIDDSFLFVFEKNKRLLQFDKEGNFIRTIGKIGSNDGEYSNPIYFELDPQNKQVILYEDEKKQVLIYDYYSKLLEVIQLKEEYFHYYIPFFNNDILAYTMKPFTLFNKGYNIGILSRDGSIKKRILKRSEKFDPKIITPVGINSLYSLRDSICLWQFHYDTVYRIHQTGELVPKYSFDFGKYKMPMEFRNSKSFMENSTKYPTIRNFYESPLYFFLSIVYQKSFKNIILNKQSSKTIQIGNTLIKNDIDGGMAFWPEGIINDNYLYMSIHPLEILQSLKKSRSNLADERLNNKLVTSKVLDNPWIIIIELNK